MRKKKNEFIEEEEKFQIFQMTYDRPFDPSKVAFRPSKVASPFFGSRVVDRSVTRDTKGRVDVVSGYDFARKESDKKFDEEAEIEKYGTSFHEFKELTNKKAAELAGSTYTDPKTDTKETKNEEIRDIKTSFVSSIDEVLNDDTLEEEIEEEADITDEEMEFKLEIKVDENDDLNYNEESDSLPKRKTQNIPSFLTEKNPSSQRTDTYKPSYSENTHRVEKDEEEDTPSLDSFDVSNDDLSFSEIPDMVAPDISFNEDAASHNNAPIDRNMSIKDAIEMGRQGQFPERMHEEEKPVKLADIKPMGNDYTNYSIPFRNLFKESEGGNDTRPAWLEEKQEIINSVLQSFNIDGEVIDFIKGPAFTLYEISLENGVNVKKITQIKDNLTMSLAAKSLRIMAPIPGKTTVGIEAPNDVADTVAFGDILSEEFVNDGKPLNVALGKHIDGSPVYQDITAMPHALIAGATQSGKSVSINTIIISLLVKNSPADLKLILVDPKMVEFAFYKDIPHPSTPVINDPGLATEALKWACKEMDDRYELLAKYRVRKISDYNKKRKEDPTMPAMPFIVIIIDEFNDLVMLSGQDVNDCIVRIAQKARACGIHVILATQRPTTNVVNGTIKANIPCRIAFKVASPVDSVTILDEGGAEDLLGRGDMLMKNNGAPVRAQGAYVSDSEIDGICDYLRDRYEPDYMFSLDDLKQFSKPAETTILNEKQVSQESEELLYKIALYCIDAKGCSINGIQNTFGLGFNRAQRITNIFEQRGIVAEKQGTKPREILVNKYELAEMFNMELPEEDDFDM